MSICDLFNDKRVEEDLRTRLTSLSGTNDILDTVYANLDPKTVIEKTDTSIVIKIDRRKNKEIIIDEIKRKIIEVLDRPEDMGLLFHINESGNEIVIRKRRQRY